MRGILTMTVTHALLTVHVRISCEKNSFDCSSSDYMTNRVLSLIDLIFTHISHLAFRVSSSFARETPKLDFRHLNRYFWRVPT